MNKITNAEIKRSNRTHIYQLLHRGGALSRQDIVQELRLCLPTVTQNLNKLIEEGLVREAGSVGNTGGRRAKVYSVVPEARVAVGVDVTADHLTAVAVDLTGSVIGTRRMCRSFARSEADLRAVGELVSELVEGKELRPEQILGVGIGLPALVTADNREVFYGKILQIDGTTREEFAAYLPYPVALVNDANAAGFAEVWAGSGQESSFYLMLSNNVGGSVLIGGEVYPGESIHSGEAGHLTLYPGGRECYCGQRGCVDPYCSAVALTGGEELDRFFERLAAAEAEALAAWEKYTDDLAIVVNNLRLLFDCRMVLGGYVGARMAPYLAQFREKVARRSSFDYPPETVDVCRTRTEPIAAGAALGFVANFLKEI